MAPRPELAWISVVTKSPDIAAPPDGERQLLTGFWAKKLQKTSFDEEQMDLKKRSKSDKKVIIFAADHFWI